MTSPTTTSLVLHVAGTEETIELTHFRAVVAGYTGRDAAQVQHHIDELAAIGVAPPPQVPMVYLMPDGAVTSTFELSVTGENTSGEVEPVLIRHANRFYLGVGSDHTDRTLETVDIGESKAVCPKPIGNTVIAIEDWAGFGWDRCHVQSAVDGVAYQAGTLAGIRRPEELWDIISERLELSEDEDIVCFAGTLPLIGGTFIPGREWELSIAVPDGDLLTHTYFITTPKDI